MLQLHQCRALPASDWAIAPTGLTHHTRCSKACASVSRLVGMQEAAAASSLSHVLPASRFAGGTPASVFDVMLLTQIERSMSANVSSLFDDGIGDLFPAYAPQLRLAKPWLAIAASILLNGPTLQTSDSSLYEVLSGLHRLPTTKNPSWRQLSLLLIAFSPPLQAMLDQAAANWRAARAADQEAQRDAAAEEEHHGAAMGPGAAGAAPEAGWAGVALGLLNWAHRSTSWTIHELLGGPPTAQRIRNALPGLAASGLRLWEAYQLLAFAAGASEHPTPQLWLAGCTLVVGSAQKPVSSSSPVAADATAGSVQPVATRAGSSVSAGSGWLGRWAMMGGRAVVIIGLLVLQIQRWRRLQESGNGAGAEAEHIRRRPRGPVPPPPAPPYALRRKLSGLPAGLCLSAGRHGESAMPPRRTVGEVLRIVPGQLELQAKGICPLTRVPIVEACAAPSGVVYERDAILAYAHEHERCPVTGGICMPDMLVKLFEAT